LPEGLSDGTLVYVANHPELRGCRAQADTPEHALENLAEVFDSYARHFAENNLDMPAPQHNMVQAVVWRSTLITPSWSASTSTTSLPGISFSRPVPGFERTLTKSDGEHVA
jgi:predicted RNase H-like HicB family nuclease